MSQPSSGRLGFALSLSILFAAAGCGGGEEAPPASAPAEEAPATPDAEPRVFFAEPADGATVTAPVHLVFGVDNFRVEPVAEGEIHAGAGHMHVGIDTDCLPAGEIIPQANPWVHFGQAQMEFDLDLTPGEHHLVLQVGDGEHRTLPDPGLCTGITVHVE